MKTVQLIQILLPLYDHAGRRFAPAHYAAVKARLSNRFQGLTAYSRAAAEGLWRVGKSIQRDDIVVYEVMAKSFEQRWWKQYRKHLEELFRQDAIVIRAQKITLV